jgi:Polyketide cyclase / dehydrase and lipid transport
MPEGYPWADGPSVAGRGPRVPSSSRAHAGLVTTSNATRQLVEVDAVVASEHRVAVATDAKVSVGAVWERLSRLADYSDWLESTIEVLDADAGLELGAGFTERTRMSGVWVARIRWTIVDLDEPHHLEFAGVGASVVDRLGFSIDLTGQDQTTEIALTLWYTPRLGPIGSLLDLVTRSNVTNDQKRSVRTLAALAELDVHGDPGA